jgi:hypothetical protein
VDHALSLDVSARRTAVANGPLVSLVPPHNENAGPPPHIRDRPIPLLVMFRHKSVQSNTPSWIPGDIDFVVATKVELENSELARLRLMCMMASPPTTAHGARNWKAPTFQPRHCADIYPASGTL